MNGFVYSRQIRYSLMSYMNPIDLQIHTTASDGKHTPSECVRMAKQNGLHTIAITDHDTVAGVSEAEAAGRELGVRVIPGIEISAEDHGIHILGFGIDIDHQELRAELKRFEQLRIEGAKKMVENLKAGGFIVEWEDVLSEVTGATIGRPHIAGAVLKRPENREKLGGITRKGEFIERYLSDSSPYYVRRAHISAKEAIRLIHSSGGLAVWSHPPLPDFVEKCQELEKFLTELISCELDGLELFNPAHSQADVACLGKLAGKYNLLKTAGSDFHEKYDPGAEPWPRSAAFIGEYPTYGRSTEGMLEALDAAMGCRS